MAQCLSDIQEIKWLSVVILMLASMTTSAGERLDFVMDINNVLLLEDNQITPGASEYLESLLAIPEAKISFFSKGTEEMVEQVLRAIVLSNGKSALDIATKIITSSTAPMESGPEDDDLGTLRIRGWGKKDLRRLGAEIDLEQTLLIDDSLGNAERGQEKNLLWIKLPKRSKLTQSFEVGVPGSTGEDTSPLSDPLNRLVVARGIIDVALESSLRRGLSLRHALWEIQWGSSGGYLVGTRPKDIEFYKRGMSLLKKINPDFVVEKKGPCLEHLEAL